ncbi:MAG: DUF3667 domain-containing protein, partial [Sphingobacteriales bacterium]
IREFINGKRVQHFKPFSLVLVLAGAYGFLYLYFKIDDVPRIDGKHELDQMMAKSNELMAANYSIAELILIPFFSLGSFIVFKKSGYNYVQHLVINLFLSAQRLVVTILLFPVTYIYSNSSKGTGTIIGLLAAAILFMWTFIQLFNHQPKFKTGLKAAWAFVFSFIMISVVSMIGGFIAMLLK